MEEVRAPAPCDETSAPVLDLRTVPLEQLATGDYAHRIADSIQRGMADPSRIKVARFNSSI